MRGLLLNLSGKLRKRTELPRDGPGYLNPVSFGNYFKPIKKLFDMHCVSMPWKRTYATFPPERHPSGTAPGQFTPDPRACHGCQYGVRWG